MTRATYASVLVVSAFIASVIVHAPSAAAAESSEATSAQYTLAADRQSHCVAKASPAGQSPALSAPPVCFDTFGAAVAFATGGAVQVPDVTSRGLSDAEMAPNGTLGSTVIGIDYSEEWHNGSSLIWSIDDPNGCVNGAQWQATGMPAGWNDVVSSAIPYQGCDHWYHYEHAGLWGTRLDCICMTMGIMNNLTSSEFWSRDPAP